MGLPDIGTHRAKLAAQIIIYEADSGALCAAVPVTLLTEGQPWSGKTTQTLVKKDGQLNLKTLDTMKALFGDYTDANNKLYRFKEDDETPLSDIPGADEITFEIVGEHRVSDPDPESGETHNFFSIQWLNVPGGGFKMPEPIDRKTVLAKYGAKFRAAGGGVPAVASAPAPAKKTTTPPAPGKKTPPAHPAPKSNKRKEEDPLAPTATMEEAWSACCHANPEKAADDAADEDKEALAEMWHAKIAEMFPGKSQTALTLKEWGRVKAAFEESAE